MEIGLQIHNLISLSRRYIGPLGQRSVLSNTQIELRSGTQETTLNSPLIAASQLNVVSCITSRAVKPEDS
jgi:hypothetical protein